MKKFIKVFLVLISILFIFSYLCFAFVQAEINPFNWSLSVRGGFIFSLVSIICISVSVSSLIDID